MTGGNGRAAEIARLLAQRIETLARDLLPGGHREGHEWRAGSVAGEAGNSLGVHLSGPKAGLWADFSAGQKGDALDLVAAVMGLDIADAISWSRRWLGVGSCDGLPRHSSPRKTPQPTERAKKSTSPAPEFWRPPWRAARPISGTIAEAYLANRGLAFADVGGAALRFAERHGRRTPAGDLEHLPALLALLRDIESGAPCGTINVYLRPDGSDRLRDPKGKTSWGRAAGSAVMLGGFADVTHGLTICEGIETGISLCMDDLRPVWCCGGAGNLRSFPVLADIEALTVAADTGTPGQNAAREVAARWREAGREVRVVSPRMDDWAASREITP